MRNRFALIGPAALTAVVLTSASISVALAADECLARPNGLAPAGKHWFYNTDRKLQRKCWYLDSADDKAATVTPRKSSVAAATRPARDSAEPPQNVDARAELVEELRREPSGLPASISPSPSLSPVPQPAVSPDAADAAKGRGWTVASRWPEPADTFASNPAPMTNEPAPARQSEKLAPAAADTSAQQPASAVESYSNIDFGLIAVALILLVVVSGTIIMLSRRRSPAQVREMRGARQRDEMPSAYLAVARDDPAVRRPDLRDRGEVVDEIDQLLAAGRPPRLSN